MDKVKEKITKRELTFGSWLSLGSLQVAEMMSQSELEWLVIDLEHTSITIERTEKLIRIIDMHGKFPFVRVGRNEPLQIKRVLDAGAKGVIVPKVNTTEQAQKAVESAYYPPRGSRGVGLYRAQKYGKGFNEYKEKLSETIVVIAQIEHIDGVQNIESILSVDGIDAFIVGPYDLSASMGLPGQFEEPEVKEALQKVEMFVSTQRKTAGYHIVHQNEDKLEKIVDAGYNFIAYGVDMIMFSEKIEDMNNDITVN